MMYLTLEDFLEIDENLLYHYGNKGYDKIRTLNNLYANGIANKNQINTRKQYGHETHFTVDGKVLEYADSISAFIDPLESWIDVYKTIGFDNVITQNKSVCEYKIDIHNLNIYYYAMSEVESKNLAYKLIRYPTNLLYNFMTDEQEMEFYNNFQRPMTMKLYQIIGGKNTGSSISNLKQIINEYKGKIVDYFTDLKSNWNPKQKHMYAPTVPHILLFPKNGEIEYVSSKIIKY